jgi:hypothetical protein
MQRYFGYSCLDRYLGYLYLACSGLIVGCLLLMCMDQMAWLLTFPEPHGEDRLRARMLSANNLRYMALAMLRYED